MKTKFTGGKWVISGGSQIVSMPSQCKIANGISGWTPEEADANGQLMVTAPNMYHNEVENLEFLRWVASKARDFNMWSDKVQLLHERIAKTENILKKATE